MKLFLHTSTSGIRIINEPNAWKGTEAQFLAMEPGYPGLPSGATVRYQTPELQYYEDASGRHLDTVNCLGYCDGAYLIAEPAEQIDHTTLENIGTNPHAQIDAYISIIQDHIENEDVHMHLQELGWRASCQFMIVPQGTVTFAADVLTWPLIYVFSPLSNARFFINAGSSAFTNRDYLYVEIPVINTYVNAGSSKCDWGIATNLPATRLLLFYNFGGVILSRLSNTL